MTKIKENAKILSDKAILIAPFEKRNGSNKVYSLGPNKSYTKAIQGFVGVNSSQTLNDFATDLGVAVEQLVEQFNRAGIPDLDKEYLVSITEKSALLDYLILERLDKPQVKPIYKEGSSNNNSNQQLILTEVNDELLFMLAKNPNLIYQLGSRKFEELIAKLFSNKGHEVTLTKQTRDGGYDILAKVTNAFSSFVVFDECKKYSPERKVGIEVVRALYGVTEAHRANKGLVITSSFFTRDAQQEQIRIGNRVELKDYNNLIEWLKPYSKNR